MCCCRRARCGRWRDVVFGRQGDESRVLCDRRPAPRYTLTYTTVSEAGFVATAERTVVVDGCPSDPHKVDAGVCGCGVPDDDSDSDGVVDCNDNCPHDPHKTEPGTCGCGLGDDGSLDSDADGTPDCSDLCPFVASGDAATDATACTSTGEACPGGWWWGNGRCWRLSSDTAPISDCLGQGAACEGGTLASVHDSTDLAIHKAFSAHSTSRFGTEAALGYGCRHATVKPRAVPAFGAEHPNVVWAVGCRYNDMAWEGVWKNDDGSAPTTFAGMWSANEPSSA